MTKYKLQCALHNVTPGKREVEANENCPSWRQWPHGGLLSSLGLGQPLAFPGKAESPKGRTKVGW